MSTAIDTPRFVAALPPEIRSSVAIKGQLYGIPLALHGSNWLFYSHSAFAKAGIVRAPRNFDEFVGALDKLKRAGIIPLAVGGQAWQEFGLFNAVLASTSGPALYRAVYQQRDPAALRSPELYQAIVAFGRLRAYTDPASPGRNWNDTVALVIKGKAGIQIGGDYLRSEFRAAGQEPDRDYGCVIGFGHGPMVMSSDILAFPAQRDSKISLAQHLLAQTVVDPKVQRGFSDQLGSIPAIAEARHGGDVCERKAVGAIAAGSAIPQPEAMLPRDVVGELNDVITEYWHNPSVSADETMRALRAVLEHAT